MIRLLILCLLPVLLMMPTRGMPEKIEYPSWITEKECARLMRYHGVLGLKLAGGKASIKRGGKWIVVWRAGDWNNPTRKSRKQ